jgi:hypothetical protein
MRGLASLEEMVSFSGDTLSGYIVTQPGKAPRRFDSGEEAIRFLRGTTGYVQLFGPDGGLLLTQGIPPAN